MNSMPKAMGLRLAVQPLHRPQSGGNMAQPTPRLKT